MENLFSSLLKTRTRVFLTYGLAMIVFLMLLGCTTPSSEQKKVIMPKYSVLDEEIYDVPVKTQIALNVLVSGQISKSGLKALLNELYSKTQQRQGFKHHNIPTHIFIYAYTDKGRAESGMGQWIAMLSKVGKGGKPEISIKDSQIAQLNAKPEEKFGLSETKRKQIWSEGVKIEDKATKEAEQKYPLPNPLKSGYSRSVVRKQLDKQVALERTLNEKYKDELAKKYGLTRKQLGEITVEGFTKDWPFPK